MRNPKWMVIARNEYLLKTAGMRRFRFIFPVAMVLMLSFYVFILAPAMFSLFSEYTRSFFLSEAALSFMQVILFLIFVSIVTIPIMQTL